MVVVVALVHAILPTTGARFRHQQQQRVVNPVSAPTMRLESVVEEEGSGPAIASKYHHPIIDDSLAYDPFAPTALDLLAEFDESGMMMTNEEDMLAMLEEQIQMRDVPAAAAASTTPPAGKMGA